MVKERHAQSATILTKLDLSMNVPEERFFFFSRRTTKILMGKSQVGNNAAGVS